MTNKDKKHNFGLTQTSGSFETGPFPSGGQTSSTSRSDSLSSIQSASSNQSQQGGTAASASLDTIPVAMALTETAHAWFVGQDHSSASRTKVRVFGSVAVSFPSSMVPLLASQDQGGRPTPLTFSLLKAGKMHALIPNKQVLSTDAVSQFHSSESHRFTFDLEGLSTYLRKEAEKRPSSPFYNVEVLRYEVRQPQAPLILTSFWKCEVHNTDLRVDYKLNSAAEQGDYSKPCPTLLNLHYSTKVDGSVANVVSKPEAEWSKAEELLSWRLTELSKHGESSGSLKARLTVDKGPSQTAPTYVQFLVQDSTMSGASLEVEGNTYRLSLLKRKVLSGKYLCEPERR